MLFQVWQRIPDKLMHERVQNNYDRTIERLVDIEDGKANTTLPVKEVEGEPISKFRWGGNARRSH